MTQLLSDVRLPKFYKVRQKFDKTHMDSETIVSVLRRGLGEYSFPQGKRIAVTAGSRGVANIGLILKTIVGFLKDSGAEPFIVPAMGSHGFNIFPTHNHDFFCLIKGILNDSHPT